MAQVKQGDTVTIHSVGKLTNGNLFDSTRDGDPVPVTLGQEQNRFPAMVVASLIGMSPGDTKTIKVSADKGFGPIRKELVIEVPKENLDESFQPKKGEYYHIEQSQGTILVKVVEIKEEIITLDANHPLAGKDLVYEIEVVKIDSAEE